MNSVIVSVSIVLLNAFFSSLVAYALAKLRFPGKNILFFIVLAFMMIPFQLLMVPLFLQISNLGLIGKYSGIILPSAISSFSIFLLRQALISLPNDYIEAALIDGAHHFRIFFVIIVPMIVPAFVTVMLTNFFWSWNNYVWPMMVSVQHDEIATMQVAIARYRTLQDMKWGATMAACTLTASPIVIVYLFMQSQFIESVAQSGLKG
ncbi:MAG: carbohydrate ABC transporter permease [Treponema sp.]|nr:carbohydrate ABC transporter permease [Treponema sp.]